MKLINNTIAIIPARAGSKGVPKKSMQLLAGHPLITYTIKAAIDSQVFDQIIITSDDADVLKIAATYPQLTLINRNPDLAQDNTPSVDVVLDAAKNASLSADSLIVLLQPTSPLRTATHIKEALTIANSHKNTSVVSVSEASHHPYKSMTITNDMTLTALIDKKYLESPRQSLPKAYYPNGAIYIAKLSDIQKAGQVMTQPILPYLMSDAHSVDIDTWADFKYAEFLMAQA